MPDNTMWEKFRAKKTSFLLVYQKTIERRHEKTKRL